MDLALRGQETDAKWADANIGPLVPGGGNRAMGATGPNDGVGGVNGGQSPLGRILLQSSAQASPPRSSPILWYNLQPLEPRVCLRLLGICLPATPDVSALLVSSAPRKGLHAELAQGGFAGLVISHLF